MESELLQRVVERYLSIDGMAELVQEFSFDRCLDLTGIFEKSDVGDTKQFWQVLLALIH